jgi:hypothetical protein
MEIDLGRRVVQAVTHRRLLRPSDEVLVSPPSLMPLLRTFLSDLEAKDLPIDDSLIPEVADVVDSALTSDHTVASIGALNWDESDGRVIPLSNDAADDEEERIRHFRNNMRLGLAFILSDRAIEARNRAILRHRVTIPSIPPHLALSAYPGPRSPYIRNLTESLAERTPEPPVDWSKLPADRAIVDMRPQYGSEHTPRHDTLLDETVLREATRRASQYTIPQGSNWLNIN